MRLLFALTPILCTIALPAADDLDAILRGDEQMPWVQIRLGVGQTVIPDVYPIHADLYGGGEVNVEHTVDSDHSMSYSYGVIAANLQPMGLVGGVEMVYNQQSQDIISATADGVDVNVPDDASSIRYQSIGGNALLGVGLAIGSHAHVELLGVLGGGACDIGIANYAFDEQTSSSGWYWNYGVRGGAYYRMGKFVVGGFVEYMHLEADVSQGWANAYTYSSPDASGVGYRIELGYHIQ